MSTESHSWRGFGIVDICVFFMSLLLSIGVGVYHAYKSWTKPVDKLNNDRNAANEDYLMGNRNMPVFPVALSLLTSFLSGILMLGTPGEVFQKGAIWWIYYICGAVSFVISGLFFLPVFFRLRITSIYEYFELRFSSSLLRLLCASVFICTTLFYLSVVLYAPAIALSGITRVPTWLYIMAIGLTCTLYTTIGGLRAVVWTDTLQATFMYMGLALVVIKGTIDVGGLGRVWEVAVDGGRVESIYLHLSPNPTQFISVWVSTIGSLSFWMSFYGLNQMAIQRYCCLPSLADVRKVIWITVPAFLLIVSLVCFLGLVILAYFYNCNPLETGEIQKADQLVILFATKIFEFLPGLSGLYMACIFSSTLSTVSSGINSMAAVTFEDFLKGPLRQRIDVQRTTTVTKILVLVYGIAATGLAFSASPLGGIIQAAISITGTLAGPLVGLFFLAIFFPEVGKHAALLSFLAAILCSIFVCSLNIAANPFRFYYLPTNSTVEGCIERNFTLRYRPPYDPHFGDPKALWLARISPLLYPLVGIVTLLALAIPLSCLFPNREHSAVLERQFALTFWGRKLRYPSTDSVETPGKTAFSDVNVRIKVAPTVVLVGNCDTKC